MNKSAFFKIGYGVYVLSAREKDFDNACIINTLIQLTSDPLRVSIALNKTNTTHDMIMNTKEFNVSVLSEGAPFAIFEHFGFHNGKDYDKLGSYDNSKRAENSIYYIPKHTNAYFSCKVIESIDVGTHTLFIADVTQAEVLSDDESLTYDGYHKNVKPKPDKAEKAVGYQCQICGYIHESDVLPDDFICPTCKHGAEYFKKL